MSDPLAPRSQPAKIPAASGVQVAVAGRGRNEETGMEHAMKRAVRAGRRSLGLAPFAALLAVATSAGAGNPMPEGYPGRGRIGIEVQPMTAELREFFAAPPESGLLIVRIEQGRPAESADLRVGDVVVAAGGEPLVNPHDLVAIVARAPGGEPLELTVVREKKTRTIAVVPDGEPASQRALQAWHERIGLPIEPAADEATAPVVTAPSGESPAATVTVPDDDPLLPPAPPEATPVHAPAPPE